VVAAVGHRAVASRLLLIGLCRFILRA
jgi:hypothetical protein